MLLLRNHHREERLLLGQMGDRLCFVTLWEIDLRTFELAENASSFTNLDQDVILLSSATTTTTFLSRHRAQHKRS